jgi:hypothetical protein
MYIPKQELNAEQKLERKRRAKRLADIYKRHASLVECLESEYGVWMTDLIEPSQYLRTKEDLPDNSHKGIRRFTPSTAESYHQQQLRRENEE